MTVQKQKRPPELLNPTYSITCSSAVNNKSRSVKAPAVARSQKYTQHHKSYCIKIPEIKPRIALPRQQDYFHCLEVPQ